MLPHVKLFSGIALVCCVLVGLLTWSRFTNSYIDPWPMMATRGNRNCENVVTATFGAGATEADFDAVIGPRIETYEIVYGPRVRVLGRAENAFKSGARVILEEGVVVRVSLEHDWPSDIVEREVVVEGCLSRTYYSWEASHLDPSKLTERQKKTTNTIRALPVGFVYDLLDVKYEAQPNVTSQYAEDE